MKVLMVAGEYYPMQGGVGDFTRCLAAELTRHGCSVSVLAPRGCTSDDAAVSVLPLGHGWGWRDLWRLKRLARGYDVVNLQYQAAAYGMRLPVHLLPHALGHEAARLVTTFHDLRVPYLFPKAGHLRREAIRWLLGRSGAAIVTNEEDVSLAAALLPSVRPHLVRIGSNIAPEPRDPAARAALRQQWGCSPGTTVVSYFGFQNASKGSFDLVQAMGELAARGLDARLVFVGGETGASDSSNRVYAEEVRLRVLGLGIEDRVTAVGYVPPAVVSQMLYASDIVALPYRDGASYRRGSLMAALAHGMPIVTTRPPQHVSGLTDAENVLLVPPGDATALADAIARLAADPALRAALGSRAAALSESFAWGPIASATLAVYKSVTARAVSAARRHRR